MIKKPITINLSTGLEARPVAQLVQVASQFNSEIYVEIGKKRVNAKSIMGMILCAGGVDKDIFLKALQGIYAGKEYLSHPVEWYRFNRNLLLYHPQTNKWTTLGEYEQGARAGAVIVSQDGFHYIINGELKPGIRTNEINRIKENRR